MLLAVVQRFLHHPIDGRSVLVRQFLRHTHRVHGHRQPRPLRDLSCLPVQRRRQPQVVQHGGPQQQRHVPHRPERRLRQPAHRRQLPGHRVPGLRTQHRRHVPHRDQHGRKRLPHIVVQFPGNRPALALLRLHQPCRELFQFRPRLLAIPQQFRRRALITQNAPRREQRQQPAQSQRHQHGERDPHAQPCEQLRHLQNPRIQLVLIARADLIRQRHHRRAPRIHRIAQKPVSGGAALFGIPLHYRLHRAPIRSQVALQLGVESALGAPRNASIRRHVRRQFAPRALETLPVFRRARRIRLQDIIPHEGSGKVQPGADLIQQPVPLHELVPDRIAARLDRPQNPQIVQPRQRHQDQQPAESRHQHGPRIPAGARLRHHLSWPLSQQSPHLT